MKTTTMAKIMLGKRTQFCEIVSVMYLPKGNFTYLCRFVEDGWLLEDTQATSSCCKKVEQLHDHQSNEVNTRRRIRRLRNIVRIILRIIIAKLQPHSRERDTLALHVPERHGERQKTLQQTHTEVRVEDQPCVYKAVRLGIARRTKHDVCLWLFVRECDRSSAIRQTADDDHEEGGQDLRDSEGDVGDDGPELGETSSWQEVDDLCFVSMSLDNPTGTGLTVFFRLS
jgi:hypothetical protein